MISVLGRTSGNYAIETGGDSKYVLRVTVGSSAFVSDCGFVVIREAAIFACGMRFIIYDAMGVSGRPGNLIAVSEAVPTAVPGTNWFRFASPVTLAANTTYYVGVHFQNTIKPVWMAVSTGGYSASDTYSDGASNAFGSSISAFELVAGLMNIASGVNMEAATGLAVLATPLSVGNVSGLAVLATPFSVGNATGLAVLSTPFSVGNVTGLAVLSPPFSIGNVTGLIVIQPWPVPIEIVANAITYLTFTRSITANAVTAVTFRDLTARCYVTISITGPEITVDANITEFPDLTSFAGVPEGMYANIPYTSSIVVSPGYTFLQPEAAQRSGYLRDGYIKWAFSSTADVRFVIYSANPDGTCGNLIVQSPVVSGLKTQDTVTHFVLDTPLYVTQGTTYWMGLVSSYGTAYVDAPVPTSYFTDRWSMLINTNGYRSLAQYGRGQVWANGYASSIQATGLTALAHIGGAVGTQLTARAVIQGISTIQRTTNAYIKDWTVGPSPVADALVAEEIEGPSLSADAEIVPTVGGVADAFIQGTVTLGCASNAFVSEYPFHELPQADAVIRDSRSVALTAGAHVIRTGYVIVMAAH